MWKKIAKKYFLKYSDLLEKQPVKTKLLTTSGLYVVGDIVAQKTVLEYEKVDWNKTGCGTLAAAGCAYVMHFWHMRLNAFIISGRIIKQTATKIKKVSAQLTLDQMFFSPFINSLFLVGVATMVERSATKAQNTWNQRFADTQKTSYMMWPAAQFLNYYFVPLQWRILYMNVIGVFWTSIRTYITFQDVDMQAQPKSMFEQDTKFNLPYSWQNIEKSLWHTMANYSNYHNNHAHMMMGLHY